VTRYYARSLWKDIAYVLMRTHSEYAVPTALGLCLDHRCNIDCVYCMRQSFKPEAGYMTLENVKNLIKRMPYIWSVTIQGLCEPFLNPETPAIIRWLKSQGYHISFTTNGMVSLTGERLDCLRDVDDFVISIDTSDPETFKYLRGGAKLDVVMQNLKRVVEMKRQLGLSKNDNPPFHINAVITTMNFHQIPDLMGMLEPYEDQIYRHLCGFPNREDAAVILGVENAETVNAADGKESLAGICGACPVECHFEECGQANPFLLAESLRRPAGERVAGFAGALLQTAGLQARQLLVKHGDHFEVVRQGAQLGRAAELNLCRISCRRAGIRGQFLSI
jgi:organic radical activating enzyme